MDVNKQKLELRKQLKSKRTGLRNRQKLNQKIIRQCTELIDWGNIGSLHTYISVESLGEVNTWLLLEYVWQGFPSVETFVPVIANNQIRTAKVNHKTEWRTDQRGFVEPNNPKFTELSYQFDVIIVPVLGFDRHGARLGYGSGHYDKFLASQTKGLKVGLAYALLEVDTLPIEAHDILLDTLITESEIIYFKR